MNLKQKTQKGFTLIELLLVISIISLLSTVVLASLQNARGKASLAAVKQQADGIRKEAEIYFTNIGHYSYSSKTGSCPTATDSEWGFLGSEKGVQLVNNLKKLAGNIGAECAVSEDSWAISLGTIALASNSGLVNVAYADQIGFICFDSSGGFVSRLSSEGSDADFRDSRIQKTNFTNKFICN